MLLRAAKICTATRMLSIEMANGQLPTEFRLFVKGWNDSEKGKFLFDDQAAAETMAAYKTWGVDLMIDLEHQGLQASTPIDPTARDARGWCRLELRADGSLWAVNVTWTPDGAERLSQKRQRYISPAFGFDADSRRVTNIINVAITAIPATHDTPALVAARAQRTTGAALALGGLMDPKLVQQALDALISGDSNKALEILQSMIAAAAGAPPSVPSAALPAAAAAAAPKDAPPPAPPAAPPAAPTEDDKKKEPMAAAARLAMTLTGLTDPTAAMAELFRRSAIAVDVEQREAQLRTERATIDATERRKLVGELVKLGIEIPATAWSDDKGTVPCVRLAAEPIDDLRKRVATLSQTPRNANGAAGNVQPPAGGAPTEQGRTITTKFGTVSLSARELAGCAEMKIKPEEYAENKAIHQQAGGRLV